MSLSKKDRQIVHDKYGGKCAYCGCQLVKGWHVDHLEPVKRKWKYEYSKEGLCTGKHLADGFENPENNCMENYMPSCASCNINKHSASLENFRLRIKRFVISLNKSSVQYIVAKRYGLITETDIEVKFYFEISR